MNNLIYESSHKALEQQKGVLYEAFHEQELIQAGAVAYRTETRQLLGLTDFRVETNSFSFVIQLKEHEILSVYPDYQEAAAFGQLFNRPN